MDEVALSSIEFRALASETRAEIIKLLGERNHTLSELSKKMGLAAPTVKQHLSVLIEAGLIECLDEGRKWKYYSLTRKGQKLVSAERPSGAFIVLALSVVGLTTVISALVMRALSRQPVVLLKKPFETRKIVESAGSVAGIEKQVFGVEADVTVIALVVAAVLFLALTIVSLHFAFRKR